ncbi:MAG: SLBB domain-containing protein [Alphaproteobacteria bacterium]
MAFLIGFPQSTIAQLGTMSPTQLIQTQQQLQQRQSRDLAPEPAVPQSIVIQPVESEKKTFLAPSRLEQILSARVGVQLSQFGYDQFGRGHAVTVPQTGAILDDYILGPGDEIAISLRGQENNEFRAVVDRNGQVSIPRLNPITAIGRNFGSFRQDVRSAVKNSMVGTEAFVSVDRVRQISVQVSGEINYPGQRLVTGLSSVLDAILLSGGVKKTGSLRNIHVRRGNRDFVIDLYSALTDRASGSNVRLADGDRIIVPVLGRTIAVTGLVRRPGIFEMAAGQSNMTVRSLLALAGDEEVRGRYRLSVLRITQDGSSEMSPVERASGIIRDSEILLVQLGADQTTKSATLSGGTGLAGTYSILPGTRLSEVLKAPGAMGKYPYTPFGIIVRKNTTTLMHFLVPFSPVAVLAGREDQALLSDDVVRVLSVNEAQLLNFIVQSYVEGLANGQSELRNQLRQSNSGSTVASEVAAQSGQNTGLMNVSSVPAVVQRRLIMELLNKAAPGSTLAQQQEDEKKAEASLLQKKETTRREEDNDAPQKPEDGDVARASPPHSTSQISPKSPTVQTLPENFTGQSVNDGHFATNREVQTFGQFARQLNIDPQILVNFLLENRMRIDGAVRGPGYFLIGPNVSLKEVVEAAGGTVNWADESGVELISTVIDSQLGRAVTQQRSMPLKQDTLASYIVKPRDQVRFSQIYADVDSDSVSIQGEVRFGGTFTIMRGEHLSHVLARAGGLTDIAYPYGAVFLRQSAAQKERESFVRAADEVQNQLLAAMTRVGTSRLDPNAFASMQGFVTELRNQRGVGRISVTVDPKILAKNPALDPMLESGDVIYIPQRPTTVSVLGQVLQPGSYDYVPGATISSYLKKAGGYSSAADESQTFVVLPDGSAQRVTSGWVSFNADTIPPGSTVMVPRDISPLDLRQTIIDVSQIFSQFAVAIASVAVLSKQ